MTLNRRDFFRQAFRMAGAVAVLPLAGSPAVKALAPIIEYGTPIRGMVEDIPPSEIVGRMSRHRKWTLDENASSWCRAIDYCEKTDPGLRALLSQRLIAQQVGLPWEDIQQALWKVWPEQAGLDGWTHHALALTEGQVRGETRL